MPKLSVSRTFGGYKARSGQRRGYRNRLKPDHGESSEDSNSWTMCEFFFFFRPNHRQLITKTLTCQASLGKAALPLRQDLVYSQCTAVSEQSYRQGLRLHWPVMLFTCLHSQSLHLHPQVSYLKLWPWSSSGAFGEPFLLEEKGEILKTLFPTLTQST